MKNLLLFCILFFFIPSGAYSQSDSIKLSLPEILQKFDRSQISVISYSDPYVFWDRQELIDRLQKAVFKDTVWFEKYFIKYRDSIEKPYHPNLGLTENEFNRLMLMNKNNPRFSKSKKVKVNITKIDSVLHLKTDNALNLIGDLKIDLNSGNMTLYGVKLPNLQTVEVTKSDNVLNSSWYGYKWGGVIINLKNLNEYLISVTLGILDKTNQIYLQIKSANLSLDYQERNKEITVLFKSEL